MPADSNAVNDEYAARSEQAIKFLDSLQVDLESASHLLTGNKTDSFSRRTYVRTAGAFVEGTISYLKDWLETRQNVEPFLSRDELTVLEGNAFYLDKQGVIRKRRVDYSPAQTILFLLPLVPRASYCKWQVRIFKEFTSWQSFTRFLEIRNAVIHPTRSEHLVVSDSDLESVHSGINWFVFQTRYSLALPIIMGHKISLRLLEANEKFGFPIPENEVPRIKQFAELDDPYGKMVTHLASLALQAGIGTKDLLAAFESAGEDGGRIKS